MRHQTIQRLSDQVDVDGSDGLTQPDGDGVLSSDGWTDRPGCGEVSKMSMIESWRVSPLRYVPDKPSLVSSGQDVLEVTHVELDYSETEDHVNSHESSSTLTYLFCLYSS